MDPEDAHALVIGISAYRRVRRLPAVHDAQDVAAVLADPARCGYPPGNVRVLLEEAATRAAILGALDDLAARAGPEAAVFVYFSGHGGSASRAGIERCYLMPVEAAWRDREALEATSISGAELSTRLRALAAARVTVVLDCCRAAGLAEPKDADTSELDELTRSSLAPLAAGRGRAVLAASRADGSAFVRPGQRNGVFTRHLLDGLRGRASRAGGVIRICDLFDYVQERVVAEQPGQRPVFKAELEENYPIARAPAATATATATAPAPGVPPPIPIPPAPDGYAYDVFLSYARRDPEIRAWVERVLVPFLEGCGLEVCLEHRDFRLGMPRAVEMERAVQHSRYTVAVLAPAYLSDEFAEFQRLLAQHLSLETREPRLVPVLRRECNLALGTRMTSLLDLTRDDEVPAGLARLAVALREPPRPRRDP
jgi:hypothetical protein